MGPGALAVSSPSSPGVGIGVGGSPAEEAGGGNPNLLLWTEEFDNAVWSKSGASVAADVDGNVDRVTLTATTGSIGQTSATAASVGATATATASLTASMTRFSVSGTYDGLPYTFSVEMRDAATPDVQLRLEIVGGFLRASIRDVGDAATPECTAAQLEQSATATAYQRREGT